MSMMVSFVLSFFPRDVLDEILNLIESVSEDFPSYSFIPLEIQKISFLFYICRRKKTYSYHALFIQAYIFITQKG